jgi:hypothetical protein
LRERAQNAILLFSGMYQIAILNAMSGKGSILRATVEARVRDLNLDPATDVEFLDAATLQKLDPDSARVGILFSDGASGTAFEDEVRTILDSPAVVIPVVDSTVGYPAKVPAALHSTNGFAIDPADTHLESVAGLVLEVLGLLRRRRRLFISYKRSESAAAAQQLYHALDSRSFDVFLDTLSVRAADQFQEQLWHRMADSDVVVLLYTASIHSSGWVSQEIERASGMKITVLQLIWPGVTRDPQTQLFEPLYLQPGDFDDPVHFGGLTSLKAAEVCALIESLRAKSNSRRQSELVGALREGAAKHGITTAVQPSRHIDVHLPAGGFARVVPAVGVPDSESFQASALAPPGGAGPSEVVLLYDALNVTPAWREHLDWLTNHLPVKTVKLFEMEGWLAGL